MHDLETHGVKVTGVVESSFWKDAAGWLLPLVILGVLWVDVDLSAMGGVQGVAHTVTPYPTASLA